MQGSTASPTPRKSPRFCRSCREECLSYAVVETAESKLYFHSVECQISSGSFSTHTENLALLCIHLSCLLIAYRKWLSSITIIMTAGMERVKFAYFELRSAASGSASVSWRKGKVPNTHLFKQNNER